MHDWRAMRAANLLRRQADGDPHQMLLDIVGLHPGSVEWSQRYAESLQTLFNRLNLLGLRRAHPGHHRAPRSGGTRASLLTHWATPPQAIRRILEKVFSGAHNLLKGGVVDDQPLSETERHSRLHRRRRATTSSG